LIKLSTFQRFEEILSEDKEKFLKPSKLLKARKVDMSPFFCIFVFGIWVFRIFVFHACMRIAKTIVTRMNNYTVEKRWKQSKQRATFIASARKSIDAW